MNKKIILIFAVAINIFVALSGVSNSVYAASFDPLATTCEGVTDSSAVCDEKSNTDNPISGSDGLIFKAVRIITLATGIASIIVIVLSGFKYVTANGDSNSINSAKNTLLYAVIGLVVSVLSQAIILFVVNKL